MFTLGHRPQAGALCREHYAEHVRGAGVPMTGASAGRLKGMPLSTLAGPSPSRAARVISLVLPSG